MEVRIIFMVILQAFNKIGSIKKNYTPVMYPSANKKREDGVPLL